MKLPRRKNFDVLEKHKEKGYVRMDGSKKLVSFDEPDLLMAFVIQEILFFPFTKKNKTKTFYIHLQDLSGYSRIILKAKQVAANLSNAYWIPPGEIDLVSPCCAVTLNMEDIQGMFMYIVKHQAPKKTMLHFGRSVVRVTAHVGHSGS